MKKLKILVVDDEPVICELLKMSLEREGFEIVTARDGISAIEWLRANPNLADLVITDCDMGGMNGLELIRTGKKISKFSAFWLWTGRPSQERANEAVDAGATRFFNKPTETKELLRFINIDFDPHSLAA